MRCSFLPENTLFTFVGVFWKTTDGFEFDLFCFSNETVFCYAIPRTGPTTSIYLFDRFSVMGDAKPSPTFSHTTPVSSMAVFIFCLGDERTIPLEPIQIKEPETSSTFTAYLLHTTSRHLVSFFRRQRHPYFVVGLGESRTSSFVTIVNEPIQIRRPF